MESSVGILFVCDGFEMGWINTVPVTTKMVYAKSIWNRSYKQLIGQTMSGDSHTFCTVATNNKKTVAGLSFRAQPKPAAVGCFFIDLCLKSLLKRLRSRYSLLPILKVVHTSD